MGNFILCFHLFLILYSLFFIQYFQEGSFCIVIVFFILYFPCCVIPYSLFSISLILCSVYIEVFIVYFQRFGLYQIFFSSLRLPYQMTYAFFSATIISIHMSLFCRSSLTSPTTAPSTNSGM